MERYCCNKVLTKQEDRRLVQIGTNWKQHEILYMEKLPKGQRYIYVEIMLDIRKGESYNYWD